MRKSYITAALAALMLAFAPQVHAQSMLKKLKTQAKQAVVGAILPQQNQTAKPTNANTATAVPEDVSSEEERDPIQGLLTVDAVGKSLGEIPDPNREVDIKAQTFSQVLKSRPAMFDGKLLATPEGIAKICQAQVAQHDIIQGLMMGETQMSQPVDATPTAPQMQNQAALQLGQELMAAVQAKGLDIEKLSEDQMRDITAEIVGKKVGIPAAEMKKIYSMAPDQAKAYVLKNYPAAEKKAVAMGLYGMDHNDESEGKTEGEIIYEELDSIRKAHDGDYEEIGAEIEKQVNKLKSALDATLAGKEVSDEEWDEATFQLSPLEKKIRKMQRQVVADWSTSEACKRVQALYAELSKRTLEYCDSHPNVEKLPDWWVESRKQQNAIIREWNAQRAEKWNADLKALYADKQEVLERVAALEDRVEALGSSDPFYRICRSQGYHFYNDLMEYVSIPFRILDCPQAELLSEDPFREAPGGKG